MPRFRLPNLPGRIVDKLRNVIKQRREGPGPSLPPPRSDPGRSGPRTVYTTTGDPQLDEAVRSMTSLGPLSLAELQKRIKFCADHRLQGRMLYHGNFRNVEPMSYRYRAREERFVPLLYAWCWKDRAVEAFKLQKVGAFQVTYQPYMNPTDHPIEAMNPMGADLGGLLRGVG